jgi:hypothetical protein
MHYDGKLQWQEAEALALADILNQAALVAETSKPADNRGSHHSGKLFDADEETGPYGRN